MPGKPRGELLLGTVGSVSTGGVTLLLDGSSTATQKKYRSLVTGDALTAGDRVLVCKMSGTYIVIGRIETNPAAQSYTLTKNASLTNWTIDAYRAYRKGGTGYLELTITVTADEDAGTKTLLTLPTAMRPVVTWPASAANGENGATFLFSIGGTGTVYVIRRPARTAASCRLTVAYPCA